MQERIKQIPTKFVEFWNKYTGVQKTIIISVICVDSSRDRTYNVFCIPTDLGKI